MHFRMALDSKFRGGPLNRSSQLLTAETQKAQRKALLDKTGARLVWTAIFPGNGRLISTETREKLGVLCVSAVQA
jgi:hypothetical protein